MGKKLIIGKSMSNTIFHSGYNEIMRSMDELMDMSVSDPLYDMIDNLMNDSVNRSVFNSIIEII